MKDGQVIRYLQLAHNEWDPRAGVSRTKVLHSFGREELDRDAVRRLVAALSRLLDPADAVAAASAGELTLTSSRPVGGTYALDQLWRRLGLDAVIRRQLTGRRLDPRVQRVLFALVANRALAASSKLAAAGGSAATCTSTAWMRSTSSPATGRWTTCSPSSPAWRKRPTARSRTA